MGFFLRPREKIGKRFGDGHHGRVPLADFLTLTRIPLGGVFVVLAARPMAALAVLAAAGLSDVLDGWVARRQRGANDTRPHRGDWLDPLCDKLFVGAVMLGLYLAHRPPAIWLLLTISRELLQLASLAVYKAVPRLRRVRYDYSANWLGKATTIAQFLTAAAFLVQPTVAPALAAVSAALGGVAVAVYIARLPALARE
jgi:phosphatidylglycerophosphate synthase